MTLMSFPKCLIGNPVYIETISPIEPFGDDNLNVKLELTILQLQSGGVYIQMVVLCFCYE